MKAAVGIAHERQDRKYLLVLVAIAFLILIAGYWLKPVRKVAEAVPSEAERLRLQMLSQKKSLANLNSYLYDVASTAAANIVWLDTKNHSAVVWGESGHAVTVAGNAAPNTVDIDEIKVDHSVSLLEFAAGPQPPGAWLVEVARRKTGDIIFAQGTYVETVTDRCGDTSFERVESSLPLGQAMLGGGVFDLDGRLAAVILACGTRPIAVTPQSAQKLLETRDTLESRLLAGPGLLAAKPSSAADAYFKASGGLLVSEVRLGSPADLAGLQPGDRILEIGQTPVSAPESLQALLESNVPELAVQRGRGRAEPVRLQVASDARSKPPVVLEAPPSGPLIRSIDAGSKIYKAGLRSGDRILSIAGQPPQGRVLQQFLSGELPASFVIVERQASRIGVIVE